MVSSAVITGLSLLSAASVSSAAAVASRAPGPGDFSIRQVLNRRYSGRNVTQELTRVYQKFGATLPEGLPPSKFRRRAGTQQGSVVNMPSEQGLEYLIPVQIGTPPQTLEIDLDTGSSDLWVFSSETAPSEVNGQVLYHPGSSSTATLLPGATWNITYGDGGSSSGIVVKDLVSIGGVQAPTQAVEIAQNVSAIFTQDPTSDGLMGMAFSTLNTIIPQKQTTFFDSIKANLSNPVFTADLRQNERKYIAFYVFFCCSNSAPTKTINFTH